MRPSLLTWLCTSLSAGFASVGWSFPALSPQSRAPSTSGTVSSAAYPCCMELLTLSHHILSQARRLEICNIEPGDCAAVCSRSVAASHHRDPLCFSWHVCSRCSFPRDLDLFLKLRHVGEFSRMSSFHLGHSSCRTREANFSGFAHCNHTLLV